MRLILLRIDTVLLVLTYIYMWSKYHSAIERQDGDKTPIGLRTARIRLIARLTKSENAATAHRLRRELKDQIERVEAETDGFDD